MKLQKAIEILTLDVKGDTSFSYDDWQDALKLGIEALKLVKGLQGVPGRQDSFRLPGETTEEEIKRR